MGTTVEKLNKVLETKEAIRTSINNKGGTLTESDTFSSYATAIDNIQTGGTNGVQQIIDNKLGDGKPTCRGLFQGYLGTSLDDALKNLDFSKVTDMCYMFHQCYNLISVPSFDTSNVIQMYYMFAGLYDRNGIYYMDLVSAPYLDMQNVESCASMFAYCDKLINVPQLNLSNVSKFNSMFSYCKSLKNLPPINNNNATDMQDMFKYCYLLEKIDIAKITSSSYGIFNCCYSLKILIIRTMNTIPTLTSDAFTNCYHFYGTTNATYNPEGLKDGAIYVPDDKVEELKVATNWSVFADIIKPLSTLVEE